MPDIRDIAAPAPMQTQRLVDAFKTVLPDPASSSGLLAGIVSTVDYAARTASVFVGASSDVSGPFVYLNHVAMAVGITCWLAPLGDSAFVIVGSSGDPWVANFAPAFSQGVGLTSTVNMFHYMVANNRCHCRWRVTITSAGTANNKLFMTLPVSGDVTALNSPEGSAWWFNGANIYPCLPNLTGAAVAEFTDASQPTGAATSSLGLTGTALATAAANGWVCSGHMIYEIA